MVVCVHVQFPRLIGYRRSFMDAWSVECDERQFCYLKKKKSKLQKRPWTMPCGSLCYYCSLVLKCCNSTDKNGKGWCWVASSLGLFGLSCLDSRGCTHGMSCWSILRQLHPSQMMNLWCLCAVRPLWVGWNFMSGCFLTGGVCDNFNNLRSAHEWSLESSILYLLFGRYRWYLAIKLLSFSKMCLERSWIYLALSLILGSSWHKESWNILYLPSWKLLCFAVEMTMAVRQTEPI